ncbi:hypothetical protein [Ideonella sp.]|uniref:hypothetical protein n=1 Tax=Ideonella sp. TaxID=1929293 RepID=UPI0035AF2280
MSELIEALQTKIRSSEQLLATLEDEDQRADLIGDLTYLDLLLHQFRAALSKFEATLTNQRPGS